MADTNKGVDDVIKGVAAIVTGIATLVGAVAKVVHDVATSPKNDNTVEVPQIYSKVNPVNLDQALEALKLAGFKPTVVPIVKPDSKYRNCIDMEVVSSNPTAGSKAAPGTSIIVNYVTAEIIEKSGLIFAEEQAKKEEHRRERAKKRAETLEKAKSTIGEATEKAKSGLAKVLPKGKDISVEETEPASEPVEAAEEPMDI